MQHYAAQMLYYLSSSGSRVQVLGISPGASHIVEKTGLEDGNGHSWPEYWYRKGRDCGDGESGSVEIMSGKGPVKEGEGRTKVRFSGALLCKPLHIWLLPSFLSLKPRLTLAQVLLPSSGACAQGPQSW